MLELVWPYLCAWNLVNSTSKVVLLLTETHEHSSAEQAAGAALQQLCATHIPAAREGCEVCAHAAVCCNMCARAVDGCLTTNWVAQAPCTEGCASTGEV